MNIHDKEIREELKVVFRKWKALNKQGKIYTSFKFLAMNAEREQEEEDKLGSVNPQSNQNRSTESL